jgi:TPR repeat protein
VKDSAEAVRWIRVAAEAGDVDAKYNLGSCYLNGTGVAKDISQAVRWLQAAADQGDEDACQLLARLTSMRDDRAGR